MSQNNQAPITKPKAIILDCEGAALTQDEIALFKKHNPYGFILFKRNCETPEQVKKLVTQLRDAVGRPDAPVLIDQEGGTVARLKAPEFEEFPPAKTFKDLGEQDSKRAARATYLNAVLMARQLSDLGIDVNCTPVLDIPVKGSHDFLAGSRVYGETPEQVTVLGQAICEGHLDQGVTPILKHIPGHGRATSDSHFEMPKIAAKKQDLETQDFKPFQHMATQSWGEGAWAMTAHVVYQDVTDTPGTLSKDVIDLIRHDIGFNGVLIADDISMKALQGDMPTIAKQTLEAGCDLTLLCNQDFETRKSVLEAVPEITLDAEKRLKKAEDIRQKSKKQVDIKAVSKELNELLSGDPIADERNRNRHGSGRKP